MNILNSTISLLLTTAILFPSQGQEYTKKSNNIATVKLLPVVFGGNRYVVEADFGLGEKVPLMIHGNARLYLMLTHDVAEKLNNNPIEKISNYGYSNKGMGKINVEKFQVSDRVFSKIENVRVFDWPEAEGKAAQGMLGIYFLQNEKVRVDFVKEQITIGVGINTQPDKGLLNQGYSYTEFSIENGEAYMNVYFDALNQAIPITIGTVSDEYSLDLETFKKGVEIISTSSENHSPSGTTPQVFTNSLPIKYKIGNHVFEIETKKAEIYSFAEYENVKQAELFPFGIFGRDWMKENNVIIDYANKFLYFKRN